jgi:hypothetical protein
LSALRASNSSSKASRHQHTVNLSWNASTPADISGYNIYPAVYTGSCGTFFKINSILNTSTLYADSEVTGGSSYGLCNYAVNARKCGSSRENPQGSVKTAFDVTPAGRELHLVVLPTDYLYRLFGTFHTPRRLRCCDGDKPWS